MTPSLRFSVLTGLSALFLTQAYAISTSGFAIAQVLPQPTTQPTTQPEPQTTIPTESPNAESPIKLEETIKDTSGDILITREYTFSGEAGEAIVVYVEALGEPGYYNSVEIYEADGDLVQKLYLSLIGANDAEWSGDHDAFLLPETGQYRLVFSADNYFGLDPSMPPKLDALLRVRTASAGERSLIQAEQLISEDRSTEALAVYAQAIETDPNFLLAYLQRLELSFKMAADKVAPADEEADANSLAFLEKVFNSMEADTQTLLITDLRQASALMSKAVAEGRVNNDEQPYTEAAQLYNELVTFFETGESSDYLQEQFRYP
jgi:hypothetical protein